MIKMEAKDRLIFPLDFSSLNEAKHYVELLKDYVGIFKVGLQLFVAEGPKVIQTIAEGANTKIFLDLKFHDIPVTIKSAQKSLSEGYIKFITVHCDQGLRLLKAIGGVSDRIKILAVTVLTSLDTRDLIDIGIDPNLAKDPSQLVLKRAEVAYRAGCDGVVCSGLEAKEVKSRFGKDFIVVTPGIRPQWGLIADDDQKRVVTPYEAIINGADYIIVGRPIRDAPDPKAAAQKVVEEIKQALNDLKLH